MSDLVKKNAPAPADIPRGSVICSDCRTVHPMGNGITCVAEKRGHSHLYSHCPTCGHKTWSEAFVMRLMTSAEIAAALSSLPSKTCAVCGHIDAADVLKCDECGHDMP